MKFATAFLLTVCLTTTANAFGTARTRTPFHTTGSTSTKTAPWSTSTSRKAKYGPSDAAPVEPATEPSADQKSQFIAVFDQIMNCDVREQLPSILTNNIELLLELQGKAGVNLFNQKVEEIEATGDEEMIQRSHAAVEYIVYFLEAFVSEAKLLDDNNKQMLGKIFKCMTEESGGDSLAKQEKLDELIKNEKTHFTPGFLRHLDGECTRIANAKKMDKETTKMLEVMRIIQTRIIEELGQDLGEGAQVLGQLLGYESSEERMAVLDAGLKVRGMEFAKELKAMTEEALQGFNNVPGGVDPKLLKIVGEMDERIQGFIAKN